MAIDPKTRGLEDEKAPTKPAPATMKATTFVKVIGHGPGWLIVEMDDDNQYRYEKGTLAWRNRNPGNVKFGDFAKRHGAIGVGYNDMAVFPTVEHGKKAMRELLFGAGSRYLPLTIKKMVSVYAPDYDDNDPDAYCEFICRHARLSNLKLMSSLNTEERERLLKAMQTFEGSKPGTITKVTK